MTNLKALLMPDEGRPERAKAALAGIAGGLAGVYALHLYWWRIAPRLFPLKADPANHNINPAYTISLTGKHYRQGETTTAALGRLAHTQIAGVEPEDALARRQASDLAAVALGITAGILYGGTRTTTRPRDLAGGFFYGLRLWLGDTFGAALLGLRPGPGAYSAGQHLWRLSGFWVYSFTTTAVTRLLYRLLA